MSKIKLTGDSSGYVEISAPSAAGNNTLELPASGSKIVVSDGSNNVNIAGITTIGNGLNVTGGNIGVGTNNPQYPIHLIKSSYPELNMGTGTVTATYGIDSGTNTVVLGSTTNHPFSVVVAGSEKARINTSGVVITPNNIAGGLDIGYKKLASIAGNYSANVWYNTGIDRTTDTGIYLLNAWVDTYAAGGQSYQMNYVGWFTMPNRATNSGGASNITLHSAGHAPNAEVIQFRTLLTPGASDSRIYLQWLSNTNLNLDNTAGRTFQVAIHRFASALNNA